MRIPFLLLSFKSMERSERKLKWLGRGLCRLSPSLGDALGKIRLDISPQAYATGSLLSSLIYGVLVGLVSAAALLIRGEAALFPAIAIGAAFWLLMLALHLTYPGILMRKIVAKESKDLLFALREIMIDVNSGVPLFDAMKNVACADYGYISRDFEMAVRQIERGVSQLEALRNLALSSESEYFKRAIWQIVNALETGSSMGTALPGIVQSLENHLFREIKDYSANLNFLMLIYMLTAAVVPSMGITFMVLLSAFSELGVTMQTVAMLVGASAIAQIVLMGYMGSTRPEIFGG